MTALVPKKPKVETPDPAQFSFSPLFAHNLPNVSPEKAATALGMTGRQVRDLIDSGVFLVVGINDETVVKRSHVRILRYSIEAWWLEDFLAKNGFEYPFSNSAEIAWWRVELRKRRATLGHQPSSLS